MRNLVLTFAVATTFVASHAVQAASLTITPTFAGAFNAAFEPIAGWDPAAPSGPAVVQVDFMVTYDGTNPMGGVVFNVTPTNLGKNALLGDWQSNNPTVDSNGGLPGGNQPLYTDNGDLGDPTDFVGITTTIATNLLNSNQNVDPRLQIGRDPTPDTEPRVNLLGSLYLDYTSGNASVGVSVLDLIISNNGLLEIDSAPSITVTPFSIGGTVDPGDPVLGGMVTGTGTLSEQLQGAFSDRNGGPIVLPNGVMATNDGEGTIDFGSLIGEIVFADGTPSSITGIATNDGTGKFSLSIDGPWGTLPRGYDLSGNVVLSGAGLVDVSLPFSIAVPEPSTVALSALALVGLVGFARRKK
jgi:hypothetical protein